MPAGALDTKSTNFFVSRPSELSYRQLDTSTVPVHMECLYLCISLSARNTSPITRPHIKDDARQAACLKCQFACLL